jgi:ankyrin repeat protein
MAVSAAQKKLWDASLDGDVAAAEAAITEGAVVNAPDEEKWGSTALHISSGNGHHAVVNLLAAKKADLEVQDEDGWRAIHHAAKEGHDKATQALLDVQADTNAPAQKGVRPLHLASRYGHEDTVMVLLGGGADLRAVGDDGDRAILHASEKGHDKVVKMLIAEGANVNFANKHGSTPLHYAAENRHAGVVATLLEEGADSTLEDSNKKTPMALAEAAGHKNVISVLKTYSPSLAQMIHVLADLRAHVDNKLDNVEGKIAAIEVKTGVVSPAESNAEVEALRKQLADLSAQLKDGGVAAPVAATPAPAAPAPAPAPAAPPVAAPPAAAAESVPCPLDARREAVARSTFGKLDKDGGGSLNREEFFVILQKINPDVTMDGVAKAFKKAKVVDAMDLGGFFRWADKMFGKADDDTFDGVMKMFE